MKIAVLIAGEYREFDLAHKNWKFLNYPNVDCYFSTWDVTRETNIKLNIDIEEEVSLSRIEQFIKLKYCNIENQDVLNLTHIKKMFYHWDRVIDLMEKSQIDYDVAILIRPDIILDYDDQIDFMSFLNTVKENCLYGFIGVDYKVVDHLQDIIFVSTGNSIKKLKNLPWHDELIMSRTNGHTWLGQHCLSRYEDILNIDPIKTIAVRRSNSRHVSTEEFDTISKLSDNWYRLKYSMKIAIYGDSFACINTKWDDNKFENPHLGLSWVEILENRGYEIINFSKSGSAFMFSYENFLREHKNYDLNIFVVTSPQRLYIKALDGMCMFGWTWAENEYQKILESPSYPRKNAHLEILKSVSVYLREWADWEMTKHIQHVLVNNLWNMAPNTIVIPAFNDSIEQTTNNLVDISTHELKLLDERAYNNFNFSWQVCHRKCHISKENNKVVADLIIDAMIRHTKIIDVPKDHTVKPSNPDFSFYITQASPTPYELQIIGNNT